MTSNSELPPNAIAVVGMAARLPGANTLSAFWDNLRRGEESIVTLSEDDLLAAGIPEKALANHAYVRRAALMDGIDEFDADFFGFTPQAARSTDPQHRLFLQTALARDRGRRLRPRRVRRLGRRLRDQHHQRIPAAQPACRNHDPNVIMGQGVTFDMVNCRCRTTRTTWPPGWRTRSTCAAPRCRCRPHARRRWSRFTWPARAC